MIYYPEPQYMNPSHTLPTEMAIPVQLPTLKVDGIGSVTVQPDLAEAAIGVVTEDRNLTAAQAKNTELTTAVINALRRMGVAENDISTQSYTITPQYDYVEGQQIFRGYRVQHILQVTIRDITKVGPIIDAAVASGANFVGDINFTVANPTIYYLRALDRAIENALAKAVAIGRTLNLQINPIPLRIVEETYRAVSGQPTALQAAETTPIQPGEVQITATIETVFTYHF